MKRLRAWLPIIAVLAVVWILFLAAVPESPEILMNLVWGWFFFLGRVLPEVSLRWDGILFFVIGLAIVLVTAHSFLRWLAASWPKAGEVAGTQWRFRSTFAVIGLVLMMFAVGISLTGIIHQVGWLIHSPQSLRTSKIQSLEDNARSSYRIGVVAAAADRSWIEAVLPFAFYTPPLTDGTLAWNARHHANRYKTLVPVMLNPSGRLSLKSPDGFGLSHFAGNARVFHRDQPVRSKDIDQSATLLVGEVNTGLVPWAHPDNCRDPVRGLKSKWKSGSGPELGFGSPLVGSKSTMFVKMDGSVQAVDNNIDLKVLRQLSELHPVSPPDVP